MTKEVEYDVRRQVFVTVDESKFTEDFMAEFRQSFFQFFTIEEHRQHLAQLFGRGVIDGWSGEFIEGYGPANEMGIKLREGFTEVEKVYD